MTKHDCQSRDSKRSRIRVERRKAAAQKRAFAFMGGV
jgi:hypothetical protein